MSCCLRNCSTDATYSFPIASACGVDQQSCVKRAVLEDRGVTSSGLVFFPGSDDEDGRASSENGRSAGSKDC
eukprot:scaffold14103_cov29-Tisochrysis_lutea.AAC.2